MTDDGAQPRPQHETALFHAVNDWTQWFGLFGGLTSWMLHLAIGFVLVYDGCALGLGNLRLSVGIVTVVLALIALAAMLIAYRNWQRTGPVVDGDAGGALGRSRFIAFTGAWLSGLSLLIIVLLGIPILWVPICG